MRQSIQYFLVDLDGCVSEPFVAPDWQALTALRDLSDQSQQDPNIPKLSICTGRPGPYTECVGQWLNVQLPMLFESGAGLLDGATQLARWHPMLTPACQEISEVAKAYLCQLAQRYPGCNPETSKRFDAGITFSDPELMHYILPEVMAFVAESCPQMEVHSTDISINIVWPQANKAAGLRWFCEDQGIHAAQLAYIGDTGADIAAIEFAGWGFAPANARLATQKSADTVTKGSHTHAVLEAWHTLIEHNRRCAEPSSASGI